MQYVIFEQLRYKTDVKRYIKNVEKASFPGKRQPIPIALILREA